MAVDATTTQVTLPAMGESVAEGTILEWHKAEGDTIEIDEILVEISTDKVDAEVPSPIAGTVVKIYGGEGDTVAVGAVLAEIDPNGSGGNGVAPASSADGAPADGPAAEAEIVDVVVPSMGESISEGTLLEWSVSVGSQIAMDDPVAEISTDKVDAELPSPSRAPSPSCSPSRATPSPSARSSRASPPASPP